MRSIYFDKWSLTCLDFSLVKIDVDAFERLQKFIAQYPTQREAADALGVSKQYVTQMVAQVVPISDRILHQLGLRKTIIAAPRKRKAESEERAS